MFENTQIRNLLKLVLLDLKLCTVNDLPIDATK